VTATKQDRNEPLVLCLRMGTPKPNSRRAGPLLVAATLAATMVVTGVAGAGATHKHGTTTIVKRVVVYEDGHKKTVTTFRKSGKTYKRKQWTTKKRGRLYFHSYTYLVRGKKAKKVSGKTTAQPTRGDVAAAKQRQCAPGEPAAMTSALDAFWAHFKAGHLETSPGEQGAQALNADDYVRLHTVLIENMADPSVTSLGAMSPAMQELVSIFSAHFVAAHMATSPEQQAMDITSDPDAYVRLHTVLFADMAAPLLAWADKYFRGTPETCTETSAPSSEAPATAPASDVAIDIKDNTFPADTAVAVGSKVTWTNQDTAPHTVSSMHGGPLASKNLEKGESYSFTFTEAGTYMYLCNVHPDMKGQVTVK